MLWYTGSAGGDPAGHNGNCMSAATGNRIATAGRIIEILIDILIVELGEFPGGQGDGASGKQ